MRPICGDWIDLITKPNKNLGDTAKKKCNIIAEIKGEYEFINRNVTVGYLDRHPGTPFVIVDIPTTTNRTG